ncbi:AAA family ATPase [Terrarubrum flagellatum]|uniref:AAA family ATPase n=1 Tax=Terrirubrum flagellatum TaxID=2895980 RepID=UPI0031450B7F
MARRSGNLTKLPAPYLKRIWLAPDRVADWTPYPFCLPLFKDRDFELVFDKAITIVVGENGTGKSTLLEAIAGLAGYDEAGGGKGYMPVDHSNAIDKSGVSLSVALRASWLPKITQGWFFRAESFFSVARYLDEAAREPGGGPPPDFLSHSHGEGFLRFFEERCQRQGFFIFDEPESALSPMRQIEFLKLLRRMDRSEKCQVLMATHSPLLMACPNATLFKLTKYGVERVKLDQIEHFRVMREFFLDPDMFVDSMLD